MPDMLSHLSDSPFMYSLEVKVEDKDGSKKTLDCVPDTAVREFTKKIAHSFGGTKSFTLIVKTKGELDS